MDNYPDGVTANDIDKHYSSGKCCELCYWWYGDICIAGLKRKLDEFYSEKEFAKDHKKRAMESVRKALDDSFACYDDCCQEFLEA